MAAEDGVIITEAQIGEMAVQDRPPTWHEAVYGDLPSAEHYGTALSAFDKFAATHTVLKEIVDEGHPIDELVAQDYADRAARLELGMREFCRSADIDPKRALLEILVGCGEKYAAPWEDAKAGVIARGEEPTTANIKAECRKQWGKWQFTLTDDELEAFEDGRALYRGGILEGMTPEGSRSLVKEMLVESGIEVERSYATQTGAQRTFDLTRYLHLEPDLRGAVIAAKEYEGIMGQDMKSLDDSRAQIDGEIAEVKALRDLFEIRAGEKPGDHMEIDLSFSTIEDFWDHVRAGQDAGTIPVEEAERFLSIDSLAELDTYIKKHMAFELLDVVFAASGGLHRIPADVDKAVADAAAARDVYAMAVPIIRQQLPDVSVTPSLAQRVMTVVKDEGWHEYPLATSVTAAISMLGLAAH
jgi:hypothetical protein